MARNGSGTYALPATMAPANTVSNSATVNSIMEDVADALTDSINKDGTKAFGANQSMGGFRLTSVGNGTAAGDAVNAAQVQAGRINWADAGGTADAITGTYTPAPTSLTDGDLFFVRASAANATTTPTFTPNSGTLTARTIVKNANTALAVGDIAGDGHELILRYRASDTKYELLNPKVPSNLAVTNANNSFSADQTIVSTDAGASAGPVLTLDRNSASPATSDVIGKVSFTGRDSGGNSTEYASIQPTILDATDTSEDSYIAISTQNAGTLAARVRIGQGIYTPSVTGGDKGTETINTGDYYADGVRQPKYIYSTADQGVSSSTTLTDSTYLQFVAKAGKSYHFTFNIGFNVGNSAADIKYAVLATNNLALSRTVHRYQHAGASTTVTSDFIAQGGSTGVVPSTSILVSSAVDGRLWIEGMLVGGGSDATIKFQFAQVTSNASASVIQAGSELKYIQVD